MRAFHQMAQVLDDLGQIPPLQRLGIELGLDQRGIMKRVGD